jgi:hypothetical protein
VTATDRLAEIEARANAATDGPWEPVVDLKRKVREHSVWAEDADSGGHGSYVSEWLAHEVDAEFIAAARQDMPALVAAIRAVLAEVERVQVAAQPHRWIHADTITAAIEGALS